MRAFLKSFILTILAFSISLTSTSCTNKPRYYVALGDSVSAGYGLSTPEESHTAIFFRC